MNTVFHRIAIMGAGGMGTLLGAHLNRAGIPVDLIDVNRAHVDALNRCGATVIGTETFNTPVRALTPDEMTGEYDLVFFMVKQPFNDSALGSLKGHIRTDGVVCTLQNGLPEPIIAEAFGTDRTMGCAVTFTAALTEPGTTRSGSEKVNWHGTLGRLDGRITDKLRAVHAILETVLPVEITENLSGVRWSKLLVNCTMSGVSAALGCSFGEILENPDALRCAQFIARELLLVTDAMGISLPSVGRDENFRELMYFDSEAEREQTNEIYHRLWGPSASAEASMLQDLRRGSPCEIDFINGVLSAEGRRVGVPTPVCDCLIALVRNAQAAHTVPSASNLPLLAASAVF